MTLYRPTKEQETQLQETSNHLGIKPDALLSLMLQSQLSWAKDVMKESSTPETSRKVLIDYYLAS